MKKLLKEYVLWYAEYRWTGSDYILPSDINKAFWCTVFAPIWLPFYIAGKTLKYSWIAFVWTIQLIVNIWLFPFKKASKWMNTQDIEI